MGLFNDLATFSGLSRSSYDVVDEAALQEAMDELEEVEDVEVNDDLMEACIQAAIANEQNLNMIITSIANEEMQYFVENGEEMIYEEGKISAFFNKIKAMLKKAWEKIKSIFNKALEHIRSWVNSDKKFVTKYKDTIKKYAGEIEIEEYPAIHADRADIYSNVVTTVTTAIGELDNGTKKVTDTEGKKVENILGSMRAEIVKSSAKTISSEDFTDKLKNYFGMKEKIRFKIGAQYVLDELSKGNTTEKNIKSGYDSCKKIIAAMESNLKTLEKSAATQSDISGKESKNSYGIAANICSGAITILNACQRVQLSAVSTYHTNCRKVAAKCVTKSKGGSVKESTESDFDFESVLV